MVAVVVHGEFMVAVVVLSHVEAIAVSLGYAVLQFKRKGKDCQRVASTPAVETASQCTTECLAKAFKKQFQGWQ